jgi:hypothetical protein
MKRLIFFILIFFPSTCAFSQDLIITNFGEKIKCKITNVDSTRIYFTVFKRNNELSTFINKSSVKSFQYNVYLKEYKEQIYLPSGDISCITIGFLEGGGCLVGVDMEFKLSNHLAIQGGAGYIGFGGGLNFHLKPSIRSSFISLQYWHQGVHDSHTFSSLGPNFVFRARKWITAQLGMGFTLTQGPAWPGYQEFVPIILTYAVGIYFPLKFNNP